MPADDAVPTGEVDFDLAVVGAGITGASAALLARRRWPNARIVVLEGSGAVGGKLAGREIAGVTVDVGAEAMLARRPEAVDLATSIGLDLVHPATISASLWTRDELLPLPRTLMGVPADPKVLKDVISGPGRTRAAMERAMPPVRLDPDEDVSVGDLVEKRFGREVVERLVEPMLGGVYAGHARQISLRAAVPTLAARLDGRSTLTQAAARLMPPSRGPEDAPSPAPVFAGLAGGVHRLPTAAIEASGATLRTDAMVRALRRGPHGWQLTLGPTRDPEVLTAGAVLLATPPANTAKLLMNLAPAAARVLIEIETASMAVITMAFATREFPRVSGSGLLVPPVEERTIKGATWSFSKWQWVADADPAVRVLRCSVGRHREEQALHLDDEALMVRALLDLRDAIGLTAVPIDSQVQRWGGGLPQYAVGHLDRVATIRAEVAQHRALAVAGATYDGVGIPACIASAQHALDQIDDTKTRGLSGPGTGE